MPILRVDNLGRIYQTSRDREDGGGFSSYASPVTQGDVTLGSAYVKAAREVRNVNIRNSQINGILDEQAKNRALQAQYQVAQARANAASQNRLRENDLYKKNQIKRAVSMGCSCDISTPLTGNHLTANGQFGYKGMSRDQKAIHEHFAGVPKFSAHRVNEQELQQKRNSQMGLKNELIKIQANQNRELLHSLKRTR